MQGSLRCFSRIWPTSSQPVHTKRFKAATAKEQSAGSVESLAGSVEISTRGDSAVGGRRGEVAAMQKYLATLVVLLLQAWRTVFEVPPKLIELVLQAGQTGKEKRKQSRGGSESGFENLAKQAVVVSSQLRPLRPGLRASCTCLLGIYHSIACSSPKGERVSTDWLPIIKPRRGGFVCFCAIGRYRNQAYDTVSYCRHTHNHTQVDSEKQHRTKFTTRDR